MQMPARAYGPWNERQQRNVRLVFSEDDFRRAVVLLSSSGIAAGGDRITPGGCIMIGGPFSIGRPLVIPDRCSGITVTAAARYPITCRAALDTLFDVRGREVIIRGIYAPTTDSGKFATAFVTMTFAGNVTHPNRPRVLENFVDCDRLYVDSTSGKADDAVIAWNYVNGMSPVPSVSCVAVDSPRAVVTGNTLASDSGVDAVNVGANASHVRVIGNDCEGGKITSSASSGNNVISGNTNTGTITAAGSDAVGLNT